MSALSSASDDPASSRMRLLDRLHDRFHAARADLFLALIRPSPGARLLDLGGGTGGLAARIAARVPLDVTVADVEPANADAALANGFRHVRLEGDGPLPFDAGEFDIVLCNSVIEHVTLPKERCTVDARVPEAEWRREARTAQAAFAAEIRRLAPAYFVQTPHPAFPIDPHVILPFTHHLPHDAVCRLVRWTDRFWIKSCWGIVDWALLPPRAMRALFPDARLHIERALGLPKSIVAYRA